MDIENVRRFVEEKGIDSFEALETFAVQQEASKKEAEEICNRDRKGNPAVKGTVRGLCRL